MKKNVNVFIGVVLCAVLGGCFWWLSSASEDDIWNPNEIYDEVHSTSVGVSSYTNVSSVSSSNSGLALTMSPSSALRRRVVSSYAGAYSGASYAPLASSPLASSPMGGASGAGLYTTSSAEIKSFGGGGNGGSSMGGGSMRATSSSSSLLASSPIAYSPSPISYSSGSRGGMNMSGDELSQMSAENPAIDMASAANMDYTAFGTSVAGFYNAYTSGSYGSYGNYGGGRSGIRGRQNAGMTDSWLDWLYRYGYKFGTPSGSPETGWYYTYTQSQLEEAYNDYITNYWDDMWGSTKPSFEQWLTWMQNGGESGYNYNGNWYMMAPVGDILPLIFLALLYIAFVAFKSSNSFNSLRSLKSR